jgi:hypothetical protein
MCIQVPFDIGLLGLSMATLLEMMIGAISGGAT